MGNGQGLQISKISYGSISQFRLNKVLHYPYAFQIYLVFINLLIIILFISFSPHLISM